MVKNNSLEEDNTESAFEVVKSFINVDKSVSIDKIVPSVYHNLLMILSSNFTASLYHYEHFKLMKVLKFKQGEEAVTACFLNGYSRFVITDTAG